MHMPTADHGPFFFQVNSEGSMFKHQKATPDNNEKTLENLEVCSELLLL